MDLSEVRPEMLVESGDYVEILMDGEILGPISLAELKELCPEDELPADTEIRSFGSEEWGSLYQHPVFQRRRLGVILNDGFDTDVAFFHILVAGQSMGPFPREEIIRMLDDKELLYTDMISSDEGDNWRKLYQVEAFDRRKEMGEDLPGPPTWDIFKKSFNEVDQQLKAVDPKEAPLLAELAYLEGRRSQKNHAKETVTETLPPLPPMESGPSLFSQISQKHLKQGAVMAALGLLGLWGFFRATAPDPLTKPLQERAKMISEKGGDAAAYDLSVPRKDAKPAPTRAPGEAQTAWPSKTYSNRKPAKSTSFTESEAFKTREPRESGERYEEDRIDDGYQYDDGDGVLEQDPVRQQISKEAYDPDSYPESEEADLDAMQNETGERPWPGSEDTSGEAPVNDQMPDEVIDF
jgi:hypothetical protein